VELVATTGRCNYHPGLTDLPTLYTLLQAIAQATGLPASQAIAAANAAAQALGK
jgi:hypothetical protein